MVESKLEGVGRSHGGRDAAALHLDSLTPADSESLAQYLQEKCNPTAEDAVKDEQVSTEVE